MKSIEDLVRENLLAEQVRLGGPASLAALFSSKDPNKKDFTNRVYQWIRADSDQRRNPTGKTRRQLELFLGRPNGWLDVEHNGATQPVGAVAPAVLESRSKNNVKALRLAVQSLFSVLHEKQSELAEDVAADIVATAGTEFAGQGFLNTLVGILRGAENMSAEERLAPRPVRASSTSKRVVSGAKKT